MKLRFYWEYGTFLCVSVLQGNHGYVDMIVEITVQRVPAHNNVIFEVHILCQFDTLVPFQITSFNLNFPQNRTFCLVQIGTCLEVLYCVTLLIYCENLIYSCTWLFGSILKTHSVNLFLCLLYWDMAHIGFILFDIWIVLTYANIEPHETRRVHSNEFNWTFERLTLPVHLTWMCLLKTE